MTHPFEKQIKNKLDNFEVEPSSDLLDKIFDKRAAKVKPIAGFISKKVLMFFAAASVVTSAVLLGFYMKSDDSIKNIDSDNIASIKSESLNDIAQNKDLPVVAKDLNQTENEKSIVAKKSLVNSNRSAKSQSPNYKQTTPSPVKTSGLPVKTVSDKVNNGDLLAGNASNNAQNSKVLNAPKASFNNEFNPNDYFDVNSKNRPVIERSYHNSSSHLYVYQSVEPSLLDESGVQFLSAQKMNYFPIIFEDISSESVAVKNADTKKNKQPIFLDFTYSSIMSSIHVNNEKQVNAIAKKSANASYDFRISFPIGAKVNLFSGIGYSQQSNQYKGAFEYGKEFQDIQTTIKYINDPVLGTIQISSQDTFQSVKTMSKQVEFKNVYSLVSIPLGLSYNMGYKKFDFGIHGSVNMNLFETKQINTWKNESESFQSVSAGKRFMQIGFGASFMTAYQLSSRFKLILEPGIRMLKIGGVQSRSAYNERVINSSLSVGLRYTLF